MNRHRNRLLRSWRWQQVRLEALAPDGWQCRSCRKPGRLEVDHVVPLWRGGDAWVPENLQTLWRSCHTAKTRRERPPRPVPESVRRCRELVAELLD